MADELETVADIRKDAETKFRELVEAWMQRRTTFRTTLGAMQSFNMMFDRLEAAHKRELSKAASKNGVDLGQLGDCAKLLEALKCIDSIAKYLEARTIRDVQHTYRNIQDRVRIALAAPPRNCDRFADETDAQIAFLNEAWLISVTKETALERDRFESWTDEMRSRYARWLFAPATEQKGGNDANK